MPHGAQHLNLPSNKKKMRFTENGSDLHHGPDQERRDEGEDDAGDQLEEEAVEQDIEAVQLHIGHLQHTIYTALKSH